MAQVFEGNPCRKCGSTERYCKSKRCVQCTRSRARKWREDNPEREAENCKRFRRNNPEACKGYSKDYRTSNPDMRRAQTAKRRAAKLDRTPHWLTDGQLEEIQDFYTATEMFKQYTGEAYHVDHIIPLQGELVSGLHVPWNLQILPENLTKRRPVMALTFPANPVVGQTYTEGQFTYAYDGVKWTSSKRQITNVFDTVAAMVGSSALGLGDYVKVISPLSDYLIQTAVADYQLGNGLWAREITAATATPLIQPRQTGDGTTTTFDAPGTSAELPQAFFVVVNGLVSRAGTDYTTAPGQIIFTTAPAAAAEIDVTYFKPVTTDVAEGTDVSLGYTTATGSTTARTMADRAADVVNVKDFGAVGDGVADDTAAIQAAINSSKSITVPPGNYLLSKSLEFSISNFEIRGTKGESAFVVDGDFAALTIPTEFQAENCRVSGIDFDTTTNGVGKGIYCLSPGVYLAHWAIRDCTFSTHLNYGIDANMIGCEVVSCIFGYHDRNAVGFQAIRSRGSQSAPIRVSNINKFDSCEFARCDNMPYVVEFDIGIRVEFTNCVFEVNKPTLSVVRLEGVYKPVFQGCWFEVNDCDSIISVGLKDGIDSLALSFTDGIINETGSTITAAFDFTDTQNRTLIFENNLISQGSFDLTKHDTGLVTVLSQKGNYSTNSQIDMGVYDKTYLGTGLETTDIIANDLSLGGSFVVNSKSTSTTRYSGTYQMISSNSWTATTDLEIPYANTNAGGMAIIRGTLSNGRSYSTVYAVSIRVGSGNDVDAAEIGNSGVYAPTFTFSNVGGFLTVSNADAAGTSYMTLIGF